MDPVCSYFTSFLQTLTDSVTVPTSSDSVTFIEFTDIPFPSGVLQCLLLGYERGFHIWNVKNPQSPVLLLSRRNMGVACIRHVPYKTDCLIGFTHLYATLEFPRNLITLFSCLSNSVELTIETAADVESFEANMLCLCATLASNDIEVFTVGTWELLYRIKCGCIGQFKVSFTASNRFLAWALSLRGTETSDAHSLSDKLSSAFMGIAETGYFTVKNYIEHSGILPAEAPLGTLTIRELATNAPYASIQAFTQPISQLKLSESSKLLVVSAVTGHMFHVYSLDHSLGTRYTLIYTLHRGVTHAEINEVTISLDEYWVIVSSAKGTNHVYKIHPDATGLTYNHSVFCRVKLGRFIERVYPKCSVRLTEGFRPRARSNVEEPSLEPKPPELLCVDFKGVLCRFLLDDNPILLSSVSLLRPICFREKEFCADEY